MRDCSKKVAKAMAELVAFCVTMTPVMPAFDRGRGILL